MNITLCQLRLDAIQPNRRLCYADDVIELFCEMMRRRQPYDPIDVLFDGEQFRILDGEKRFRACKIAGMTHIEARIVPSEI